MRFLKKRGLRVFLYLIILLNLVIFLPSISLKIYLNSANFKEKLTQKINDILKYKGLNLVYEIGEIGLSSGIELRYITMVEKEKQVVDVKDCHLTGVISRLVFGKDNYFLSCEDLNLDLTYLERVKKESTAFKRGERSKTYSIDFDIKRFTVRYKKTSTTFQVSGRFSSYDKHLYIVHKDRFRIKMTNINLSPLSAQISFSAIDLPSLLRSYIGKYDDLIEGGLNGSVNVLKSGNEIRFKFSDIMVKNFLLKHRLLGERPFKIARFQIDGEGSISLISGLLKFDEMRIDLSDMIFVLSGRFSSYGIYSIDFKTERLYLNDLARFFDGEEMEGFDMSGEIRLQLSMSGNINEVRKIGHISIAGDVYKPEQLSRRLNYLKVDFAYDFNDRNNKKRKVFVGSQNPDYSPFERIPLYVYGAVVVSEDAGFLGHKGVEFKEIESAIIDNVEKGKPYLRGGSTITQQIVKNLFLTREKTLLRKMKEILLAIELDAALSKERMIEIYLNGIEWGPGIFGIGQASRHYFGKSVEELSPLEAAYLASIIPNPNRYYVYFLNNEVKESWYEKIHNILYKMNLFGYLSDTDYNKSLSEKLIFDRVDDKLKR